MFAILKNTYLKNIADAIRTKAGVSTTYKPKDMPSAILNLPTTHIDGGALAKEIVNGSIDVYSDDTIRILRSGVFWNCRNLNTLNCTAVTNVAERALYECTVLKHVYLPACTTLAPYSFYSCSSLEEISLENVTGAALNVFENCTSLEKVYLPALSNTIQAVFKGCTALEKAWLGYVSAIYRDAFSGCTALKTLVLNYNGTVTLSTTDAFTGCTNVTVYVRRTYVSWYQTATNWAATGFTFEAIEDHPEILNLW